MFQTIFCSEIYKINIKTKNTYMFHLKRETSVYWGRNRYYFVLSVLCFNTIQSLSAIVVIKCYWKPEYNIEI